MVGWLTPDGQGETATVVAGRHRGSAAALSGWSCQMTTGVMRPTGGQGTGGGADRSRRQQACNMAALRTDYG